MEKTIHIINTNLTNRLNKAYGENDLLLIKDLIHEQYNPLITHTNLLLQYLQTNFQEDKLHHEYISSLIAEDVHHLQLSFEHANEESSQQNLSNLHRDFSMSKNIIEKMLNNYSQKQELMESYQMDVYILKNTIISFEKTIQDYASSPLKKITSMQILAVLHSSLKPIIELEQLIEKVSPLFNSAIAQLLTIINMMKQVQKVYNIQ